MATVRDLVEAAYRKIGVVATDEAMTADQSTIGRDTLNRMMHGLVLEGIDTGYTDLDLADQFSLDARFDEGIVYMLASRLAPDFNRPGFDERRFRQGLANAFLIVPEVDIDTAVRRTPSQWRRWR
jgi:hypothetical protein